MDRTLMLVVVTLVMAASSVALAWRLGARRAFLILSPLPALFMAGVSASNRLLGFTNELSDVLAPLGFLSSPVMACWGLYLVGVAFMEKRPVLSLIAATCLTLIPMVLLLIIMKGLEGDEVKHNNGIHPTRARLDAIRKIESL
jgi:hypothetical protein